MEKNKPPKEIPPSGPSFFDEGPTDPVLVTVASGPYCEKLPLAGKTVAELRSEFSDRFDIDPKSTAVIGGEDSEESTVLQAGMTVMFMNRAGEKG